MSLYNSFDPYAILDVDRDSTLDDIKNKFRKLTLKYHPDRNRKNKFYDPKYYHSICKAYAILSDPQHRKEFDAQYAAGWMDLRDSSREFVSEQVRSKQLNYINTHTPSQSQSQPQSQSQRLSNFSDNNTNMFIPKEKFGQSDLATFNAFFEQNKAIDPNDHGYGEEMSERMSTHNGCRYSSTVSDVSYDNPFKNGGYNERDFNRMFEERNANTNSRELVERDELEPYSLNSASGAEWTDIAVYDGNMVVGKDTRDYSRHSTLGKGNDLAYTDYKQSFTSSSISSSIPSSTRERFSKEESVDRLFQQRMSEQTRNLYDDIPANERRTFAENKEMMINKKKQEIEREQQAHRDLVLKYKTQYRDNYLEHKGAAIPNPQTASSNYTNNATSHTASHTANQSHLDPQMSNDRNNPIRRIQRYQPVANTTPHIGQTQFNQQTRDSPADNYESINERMNNRNFLL